jgi:hypothetical protein
MKKPFLSPSDTPPPFVARHQDDVIGMLQGFDRLRLQGTLRALYFPEIMEKYLWQAKVLWKDFKSFATGLTQRMRAEIESLAREAQRPVLYLPSSQTRKETLAKGDRPTRRSRAGPRCRVQLCGSVPRLSGGG